MPHPPLWQTLCTNIGGLVAITLLSGGFLSSIVLESAHDVSREADARILAIEILGIFVALIAGESLAILSMSRSGWFHGELPVADGSGHGKHGKHDGLHCREDVCA